MRYMKYLINPHNPSIEEIRLNVLKGERIGLCARIDRINSKVSNLERILKDRAIRNDKANKQPI